MRFSAISTAALAFAASAFAQTANFNPISKPATGEVVAAGSTYTIVWQSTRTGAISLSLIGGETPATLLALGTFATGVNSSAGQYAWAVDPSLGKDKTYGIQITLESDTSIFQYSFPFSIKPGSGGSSAAASSGYPTAPSTISSALSKTTAQSSYPVTLSSKVATVTHTFSTIVSAGNLSTIVSPTGTRVTTGTTSSRTSSVSAIATAAAAHVAAGSLALVGGIAAAIFAL